MNDFRHMSDSRQERTTESNSNDSFDHHAVFADPVNYLSSLGLNAELVIVEQDDLAIAA